MDGTVKCSIIIEDGDHNQQPDNMMNIQDHPAANVNKTRKRKGEHSSPVNQPLLPTVACCVPEILILHPFTSQIWSDENRLEIIRSGRQTPDYKALNVKKSLFEMFPWLTGCPKLKKLFCWPCLIYNKETILRGAWSVDSIDAFHESIQTHVLCVIHVKSLQFLGQWNEQVLQVDTTLSKLQQTRNLIETMKTIAALQRNTFSNTVPLVIDTAPGDSQRIEPPPSDTTKNNVTTMSEAYVRTNEIYVRKTAVIANSKLNDIIQRLLDCPFVLGGWSDEDRCQIIQNGRPCADFSYVNTDVHKTIPWVAASLVLNRLFCWPCLLFSPCTSEIGELKMLSDFSGIADLHEDSQPHLDAILHLKCWEKNIKDKTSQEKLLNGDTRNNLQLMKYLIDILVITHAKIDNSTSSHDTIHRVLKLISSEDATLRKLLKEAGGEDNSMKFLVVTLTERVLTLIESSMKLRIIKEIGKTPVVSLIVNNIENATCFSVIARYVLPSGNVAERFIKFIQPTKLDNFQPGYLLEQIDQILDEFNCKEKLVGYTYDGGVFNTNDTLIFNYKMAEAYPYASFYHNRAQDLRTLLLQSFTYFPVFLHSLRKLMKYMEDTPILKKEVIKINAEFFSDHSPSDVWDFTSGFITTIFEHYPAFLKMFDDIVNPCMETLSVEISRQASFFLDFLKSEHNCFMIASISRIFKDIESLTNAFKQQFDVELWKTHTKNSITKMRDTLKMGYEEVYWSTVAMMKLQVRVLGGKASSTMGSNYVEIFEKLLLSSVSFIQSRTYGINGWAYFDLFLRLTSPEKRITMINNCGSNFLLKRCPYNTICTPRFVLKRLKAQLVFMQERKAFLEHDPAMLCKLLKNSDLDSMLSELFKFAQLALTVPLAAERPVASSTLNRIETYARHQKWPLCTNKARMFVEKKLLRSIQKDLCNNLPMIFQQIGKINSFS